MDDAAWKEKFGRLPKGEARPSCPRPEVLSALAAGTIAAAERAKVLDHLSSCAACREEVVEVRAMLREEPQAERVRAGFRVRLTALVPPKPRRWGWIAAAAAALFLAALGAALLLPGGETPKDTGVAKEGPRAKPELVTPPRPPEKPPTPTPLPPAPQPEKLTPAPTPRPVPEPEKPAPPPPAPKPQPREERETAKPTPEPEKLAPVRPPDKPPTEPTLAKLRGAMLSLAGSCSTQAEGESNWQATRAAQSREFTGTVKIRTEIAAAKVRIGAHTYYVQKAAELSVTLLEGGTVARLGKGEGVFDVTPGKETVSVETASGRVVVKGTRFLVSAEKGDTEVVVQKGRVEFTSGERAVSVSAGERSVAGSGKIPAAPERADVARRLQWTRGLEEALWMEAEGFTLQQGMAVVPDAAASGGRAIGAKAPVPAGQEPSAEIRIKHKQPVPYAVWMRLHWPHGNAPGLWAQVHTHPRWDAKHVGAQQGWQWVQVGTYELPDDFFRLRIADPQGGMRIDQVLVTSDLEFNPETDKR